MKLENYEVHLPNYSIGDEFTIKSDRSVNLMEKRYL